jgi:HK97 gp10 family phage protein
METLVAYADLEGLKEDFEEIYGRQKADQLIKELVRVAVPQIYQLAYDHAPVDTGELRRGIIYEYTQGGRGGEVTATAPHSEYLEFGTASKGEYGGEPYEIKARNAKVLAFAGVDGATVFTHSVIHPGIDPQPYMRPALLTVMEVFEQWIEAGMVRLIVETPNALEADDENRGQVEQDERLPERIDPEIEAEFEAEMKMQRPYDPAPSFLPQDASSPRRGKRPPSGRGRW